ncbi:MAG: dihydroneopterin aldolase [Planctomycetota bacterium]|jgi:dihydroneopterin aldolase/D-erythro-7,8-dihydroneopterin triphosphate epimerase
MTDREKAPTCDQIFITDLRFRCIVGVTEDERREKQDIVTHITLDVDLRKAGQTDAIDDTVDYRAVKKAILVMAEQSQFQLVEALAESIADICLAHRRVSRAVVVLEKPGALRFARTVGVRITRERTRDHG